MASGSATTMSRAPASWAMAAAAARSSMPPRKLGCAITTAAVCSSTAARSAARSVRPPPSSATTTGACPRPWVSVASTCRYSGCTAAEATIGAARPLAVRGGEDGRLGERRGAVVHGGVAHVEAGELADGRLVFEDGLQHALAAFGLVGRVRGEELGAARDGVDDGRHVGVVDAGAEERGEARTRRDCGQRDCRARAARRLRRPARAGQAGPRSAPGGGWSRTGRRAPSTPTAASISRTSSVGVRHEPHSAPPGTGRP